MKASAITAKKVAILGATSDIAVAIARLYAEAGAALAIAGRDQGALEACRADLVVRGASAASVRQVDFMETATFASLAEAIWADLGKVDVAVIAYGSLPDQAAMEQSVEATAGALTLNFTSPAVLAGALATKFAAQGSGTIAVISSVAGDRGRKSNYVYGAAKGGLQHFLEGLRHRLYGTGVFVLDIRPGFVATKMTSHIAGQGAMWATPARVAADIVEAIDRGRDVLYTPWFWRPIMMIVRSLPRPLFHRTKL